MNNCGKRTTWSVTYDGDFVENKDEEVVCQLFDKREDDFVGRVKNAHLIAAAPDMLVILSKIVDGYYDDEEDETAIAVAGRMAVARRLVFRTNSKIREAIDLAEYN